MSIQIETYKRVIYKVNDMLYLYTSLWNSVGSFHEHPTVFILNLIGISQWKSFCNQLFTIRAE